MCHVSCIIDIHWSYVTCYVVFIFNIISYLIILICVWASYYARGRRRLRHVMFKQARLWVKCVFYSNQQIRVTRHSGEEKEIAATCCRQFATRIYQEIQELERPCHLRMLHCDATQLLSSRKPSVRDLVLPGFHVWHPVQMRFEQV